MSCLEKIGFKICGLTDPEEARKISSSSLNNLRMLGLIFTPVSPRCIDLKMARQILSGVDRQSIKVVGVFKDQPLEVVSKTASELNLDYVQLHGEEGPEYIKKLNLPVIKVIEYGVEDKKNLGRFEDCKNLAYFLLDKPKTKITMGAEDLLASLKSLRKNLEEYAPGVIIAGGINEKNLLSLIDNGRPDLVDICSAVEFRPGKKDLEKIKRIDDKLNRLEYVSATDKER